MRPKFSLPRALLFAVCLWQAGGWSGVARAEDDDPFAARSAAASDGPNPFRKAYLAVALTRNYPEAFAQQSVLPGGFQPNIGYRHDLDAHWLMGLSGGYKLFERKQVADADQPSRWLALLTITHDTYFALRLSHPLYLLTGPKILYMMPCENAKLPVTRDKDYVMEIGAALSAQLAWVTASGSLVTFELNRWRGLSTQRLAGLETSLGYSYALE